MIKGRPQNQIVRLIALFFAWKAFLLIIAYTSPGPGYDTSTTLLGDTLSILPNHLVRWDAIYYTRIAQQDYIFEQEWAFGWGYTRLLKLIASSFHSQDNRFPLLEAWSGIALSHLSHLLSVLALYDTSSYLSDHISGSVNLPYLASLLHILSPAGLFLSGPSPESLFSCLSFLAYNLYIRSLFTKGYTVQTDLYQLLSALLIGLSATVRSNGLLNGLLFVSEAIYGCLDVARNRFDLERLRRLVIIGLCGCIVALGYIIPQLIAHQEYCLSSTTNVRVWCTRMIPSIYNFVQTHYWNTGLFKYWTLSNLPLFIISVPCITLFIKSSSWAWIEDATTMKTAKDLSSDHIIVKRALRTLALPQVALAVLVLTSYHVQIITRLSSGYIVWYWWLAQALDKPHVKQEQKIARATVIWMATYAAIQGALFAAFLPPA